LPSTSSSLLAHILVSASGSWELGGWTIESCEEFAKQNGALTLDSHKLAWPFPPQPVEHPSGKDPGKSLVPA
jgi:hypothetical protein